MPVSRKIIIDTNFLLIPAQFGVDIFSELQRVCDFAYKVFIFDKSLKELENIIEKQKGKQRGAARIALAMAERGQQNKNINIIPSKTGYVDKAILELAEEDKDIIVATQDLELKKKLKEKGIKTITLRQKKYLAMG